MRQHIDRRTVVATAAGIAAAVGGITGADATGNAPATPAGGEGDEMDARRTELRDRIARMIVSPGRRDVAVHARS